jgi:phospholipid/cholesterol/gamma-HCH transport system substrate-binding protein
MRSTDYRLAQVRVGLFVAIAGIVLFAAVFYFGLNGSPLTKAAKVHALFDNVFGLAEGSPVEMGGVVVGQIESISLPELKTGLVPVTLSIQPDALKRLGASSVAFASSHALLGQRFIGLTARKESEPALANGGSVQTRPSEAMDALIEQATRTLQKVDVEVEQLQQFTGALARIGTELQSGQGSLGKLLRDDALYNSLAATAENARKLTDDAEHGHGAIATLLRDRQLDSELREGVGALSETAKRMRDGKGLIGRLTVDGTDTEHFDRTLANLDAVTSRLSDAKGTLGALINDPQMLARVNGLIGEVDALVSDLRRNPQRYLKISAF